MANTITKNKTAKIPTKSGKDYSYQYTDLASINKWLEENNMDYYQTIETCELNGKDYIMTYRFIDGEWEDKPKRGCQVVDSILVGNSNPVQQYGSSLTYVRRYSLCLAFGLAMEDTDAAELSKPVDVEMTEDEAKEFTITFGKYKGTKIVDLLENNGYINWLLNNSNDLKLLKAIEILTGVKPKSDEEWDARLELTKKVQELIVSGAIDLEDICLKYGVHNLNELSDSQIKNIIEKRG